MKQEIYIGNLDFRLTEAEVLEMIEAHGSVCSIRAAGKGKGGEISKGIMFAEMATPADADMVVLNLNGQPDPHYGRTLRIQLAAGKARTKKKVANIKRPR